MNQKEIDKFWSKVDIRSANECWNWKEGLSVWGYGRMRIDGRMQGAHRIAWEIANGRPPRKGYEIAHAPVVCHNRACCNPNHLSEKTRQENAADMVLDESAKGERNGRAKLNQAKADEIRELRKQGFLQRVVAERFGITQVRVSQIELDKGWVK